MCAYVCASVHVILRSITYLADFNAHFTYSEFQKRPRRTQSNNSNGTTATVEPYASSTKASEATATYVTMHGVCVLPLELATPPEINSNHIPKGRPVRSIGNLSRDRDAWSHSRRPLPHAQEAHFQQSQAGYPTTSSCIILPVCVFALGLGVEEQAALTAPTGPSFDHTRGNIPRTLSYQPRGRLWG